MRPASCSYLTLIFTAISRLDESVPFCRVEPFHVTRRHQCSPACSTRAVINPVARGFQQKLGPGTPLPAGGPKRFAFTATCSVLTRRSFRRPARSVADPLCAIIDADHDSLGE